MVVVVEGRREVARLLVAVEERLWDLRGGVVARRPAGRRGGKLLAAEGPGREVWAA